MNFLPLSGPQARQYAREIAALRLKIFYEFPYLYEGDLDYEMKYLETYFKAKHSFIFLVKDGEKVVGATTAIWAQEEEPSFKQPFVDQGFDPNKVLYFGESILLSEYRGQGIGKRFFEEREAFARSLGFIETVAFAAVVREETHPLRPTDYQPLDPFWHSQGFAMIPGMTTTYEWQDRDQTAPTKKLMQFWVKRLT